MKRAVYLSLAAAAVVAGSSACFGGGDAEEAAPATPTSSPIACGKTGQPDCPLQSWMKATLQPYLRTADMPRLAVALDQLADKPPPGFSGWSTSAHAAADAARANDVSRVKHECKTCHDQYRSRFRAELRAVDLF